MIQRAFRGVVALAAFTILACPGAWGQDDAVERAKRLLAAGNAKQAYTELEAVQDKLSGTPEFDYLFGVASLDSGRLEEAIISFERVLALIPNHAGAQMDLARAYYAAGSYDLAEAAFIKLRAANPPPAAQQAIGRYLDAIQARKHQTQPGWAGYGELGLGYDSNITGVPQDFGAAAQQSFNLSGVQATGNSVKRDAAFVQGAAGAEYFHPLGRGWSLFAGGDLRGRAYRHESDFDLVSADLRAGGALNSGQDQYRVTASFAPFWQQGAAPGDPQPTNDRRMGGLAFDWRHALDTKTQVGLGLQLTSVRFPKNELEDFDQLYLTANWLKSFERPGVPMLYLTGFITEDKARKEFFNGVAGNSTKSKNLGGVRSYLQYSISPKLQLFNGLGVVYRKDKDDYARSTEVQNGHDLFAEASIGVAWQFRDKCALRTQLLYSRSRSNIDLYDFDRTEVSSNVRCDLN
jgi:tetratricopeptide (TPR) repeat protein